MNYNNESTILQKLNSCKTNINQHFNRFNNNCESQFKAQVRGMFDTLEIKGCRFIDDGYDGNRLGDAIKDEQDRLSKNVSGEIEKIVNKETKDLKDKIDKELEKIKEVARQIELYSKSDTRFSVKLNQVLEELSFTFGDFVGWTMYIGSSMALGATTVMAVLGATNWWNPLGWLIGAISIGMVLFGDSKEQRAKRKYREKLNEAKNDFLSGKFQDIVKDLYKQVNKQRNSIITKVDEIIDEAKNVRSATDSLLDDLESMSY